MILYMQEGMLEDTDVVPYPLFLVLSNALSNPSDVPDFLCGVS